MRKFRLNLSLFKVWVWSRNTIREAIKILEYLGVLEVKQGLVLLYARKMTFQL